MHPAYQANDRLDSKSPLTVLRSELIRNSVAILVLAFAVWSGLAPAMDIEFRNVAPASGLDYTGPSWGASWGDYDRDGRPDLFMSNHANSSSIFRNLGPAGFVDVTDTVQGELSGDVHAGAWADMDSDGDGDLLMLVGAQGGFGTAPNRLLINSNGAFLESAEALGVDLPPGRGRTPLWLDWNGDRLLDAVIANAPRTDGQAPTTIFTQTGAFFIDDSASLGFNSDRSNLFSQLIYVSDYAKPLIVVHSKWPFPDRVFDTSTIPFSNVQQALGLPEVAFVDDVAAGDFDGDLETELYLARASLESAKPDYLLDRIAGTYQNVGTTSDVGTSRSCGSVVAADFDNDMDLDIYLVCDDAAHNLANALLENDGTGLFAEVPGAAGAVGSTQGRGDTAAVADYNSDGFLDILVTNGAGRSTTLNFYGPTELFHNMGNTNHWLGIDLVGVSSNADGIGAVIFVDAGGTRQVRFQGGGMHFGSQDHRRLHFGLAGNTVIDQILIKWPSGLQQRLTDVSADQVLEITEGVVPNKAPTITAISNQTIDEDRSTGALAFIVNDAETDPAALNLAASSSDQALIPDANLELGGTGTDRTIKITPKADRSGSSIAITVTVSDGEDATSRTFDVAVRPVNDPPLAQDDMASIDEGESININVTENDSDVDDSLNLTSINIVTKPTSGDVTVRENGTIDYAETAVGATSDIFTYTISDVSGAASNIATVDISITPASSGGSVGPDGGGGGGGCAFNSSAGKDPVIPLIFLACLILLSRKHLRYQI